MSEPLSLVVDCGSEYRLRVEFAFIDGRFRQQLELLHGSEVIQRWHDCSDSTNEDWPGSPPIQQLSLESINGSPTLLGVGQAGKSHWSISVESRMSDEPSFRFDVACRTANKPTWLGSTYQSAISDGGNRSRVLSLKPDSALPATVVDGLQVCCPLDLKVEPGSGRASRSITYRWGYRVGIT